VRRVIRYRAVLWRFLAASSMGALLAAMSFSAALAHAVVTRSEPPDGGVLAQAPREIRLWFSEPILPKATQARVIDMNGQTVAATRVQTDASDPTLLIVTVPSLSDGIYNVAYSALSASDGHATQGRLVFNVGKGATPQAGAGSMAQPTVLPAEALLRTLNFLALAAMAGAIAVAYLLLRPGNPRRGGLPAAPLQVDADVAAVLARARRRVLRWAFVSALVAVAAGAALLFWEAWILALPGNTGESVVRPAVESAAWLATHTQWGLQLDVRQALLLAIAALLLAWRGAPEAATGRSPAARHLPKTGAGAVLGLLSVAVLLLQAKLGHAAAVAPGTNLAVVMDSAHLTAASLWVGGLLALAVGLLPLVISRRGTPAFATLARAAWRPFGMMAALSAGVLIATGIYSAGREVASLEALLTTFYGRTLIVKAILVLMVCFFGLLNSTMLHPRLSAPLARVLRRPAGWTPLALKRLPALVMAEVAVGVLVLLATGTMVSSPPANGPEFAPPTPAPPLATAPSQLVGDLLVTFNAKPNRPGQNVTLMQVVSTRRPPPAEIMRVIVHYTFLGQDMGAVTADAQEISPGEYQVAGEQLSLPGPWQVDVVVRRKGLEDSKASFQWTVPAPSVSRPVVVSNRPLEPILTPVAILLFAGVAGFAVVRWIRTAGIGKRWPRRTGGDAGRRTGLVGHGRRGD
jgi:copper transport protein